MSLTESQLLDKYKRENNSLSDENAKLKGNVFDLQKEVANLEDEANDKLWYTRITSFLFGALIVILIYSFFILAQWLQKN